MTDPVRQIADAVLYEGYILWPYRRSAIKNQQRWTFGGVFPPAHSAAHPDDPSHVQAQVEVRGSPKMDVRVRFLQVVQRSLFDAAGRRVDELEVDGERFLAWDEATEREVVAAPGRTPFHIRRGSEREGPIERSWQTLCGTVDVRYEQSRVTVRIDNRTPWSGNDRREALRHTLCSTHVVLHADGGTFVSATDSSCDNEGLWPALVAEDTVLAAPIILPDYPQIAPESPGNLFDATEIDKLLVLNVLALTPEEQAEMRATDPRAREILERCEALSAYDLMRLHGAMRELR